MNDSTPKRQTPREETLNFIKTFARIYQPGKGKRNKEVDINKLCTTISTGFC